MESRRKVRKVIGLKYTFQKCVHYIIPYYHPATQDTFEDVFGKSIVTWHFPLPVDKNNLYDLIQSTPLVAKQFKFFDVEVYCEIGDLDDNNRTKEIVELQIISTNVGGFRDVMSFLLGYLTAQIKLRTLTLGKFEKFCCIMSCEGVVWFNQFVKPIVELVN